MLATQEPRRSQRKPKPTQELQDFLSKSPRKAAKIGHMDDIHAYSFMDDGEGENDELSDEVSRNGNALSGHHSVVGNKDSEDGKLTTVAMVHTIPYITPVSSPETDRTKVETPTSGSLSPPMLLKNCCIVPLDHEITFLKSVRDPNSKHRSAQNRRQITTRSKAADQRITRERYPRGVVDKPKRMDVKDASEKNPKVGRAGQLETSNKAGQGKPENSSTDTTSNTSSSPLQSTVKRPRGRPRKYPKVSQTEDSDQKQDSLSDESPRDQSTSRRSSRRSLGGNASRYTTPVSVTRRGGKNVQFQSMYADWLTNMSSAIMSPGSDPQSPPENSSSSPSQSPVKTEAEGRGQMDDAAAAAVVTPRKMCPTQNLQGGDTPEDLPPISGDSPTLEGSCSQQGNAEPGPCSNSSGTPETANDYLVGAATQALTPDSTMDTNSPHGITTPPKAVSSGKRGNSETEETSACNTACSPRKRAKTVEENECGSEEGSQSERDSCGSTNMCSDVASDRHSTPKIEVKAEKTTDDADLGVSDHPAETSRRCSSSTPEMAGGSGSASVDSSVTDDNTSRSFDDRDSVFGASYAYSGKKKQKRRASGMYVPLYKCLTPRTHDLSDMSNESSLDVIDTSLKNLQENTSVKVGDSPNYSVGADAAGDQSEMDVSAVENSLEEVDMGDQVKSSDDVEDSPTGSITEGKLGSDNLNQKSGKKVQVNVKGKRNCRRKNGPAVSSSKGSNVAKVSPETISDLANKSEGDCGLPADLQATDVSHGDQGNSACEEEAAADDALLGKSRDARYQEASETQPPGASRADAVKSQGQKVTGRAAKQESQVFVQLRRGRSRKFPSAAISGLNEESEVRSHDEGKQTILDHCVNREVDTETESCTETDAASHESTDVDAAAIGKTDEDICGKAHTDSSNEDKSIRPEPKRNVRLKKRLSITITPDDEIVCDGFLPETDCADKDDIVEIFPYDAGSCATMFDDDKADSEANPEVETSKPKRSQRRVSLRALEALYSDSLLSPSHFVCTSQEGGGKQRRRRRSFLEAQSAIYCCTTMNQNVGTVSREENAQSGKKSVSQNDSQSTDKDPNCDVEIPGGNADKLTETDCGTSSDNESETSSAGNSSVQTDERHEMTESTDIIDCSPEDTPCTESPAETLPQSAETISENTDEADLQQQQDTRKSNRRKSRVTDREGTDNTQKSGDQSRKTVKQEKKSKSDIAVEKLYTTRGPKKTKKRNLETIFESPRPDTNGKTNLTGLRKMSRMMTFKDPFVVTKLKATKAKKLEQLGVKKFKPTRNQKTKKAVAVTLEDKLSELDKQLSVVATPVKSRQELHVHDEQENVYGDAGTARPEKDTGFARDSVASQPHEVGDPLATFRRKRLSSMSGFSHGVPQAKKKPCSSNQRRRKDSSVQNVSQSATVLSPVGILGLSPKMIVDGTEVDPNVIVKLEKLGPERLLGSPSASRMTPGKSKGTATPKSRPQDVTNTWNNTPKRKVSLSTSPAQIGLDVGRNCAVTQGSADRIYYNFADTDHNYCKSPDKVKQFPMKKESRCVDEKISKDVANSTQRNSQTKQMTCARKISTASSPIATSSFTQDEGLADSESSSAVDTCSTSSQDAEDDMVSCRDPDDPSTGDHCYAATATSHSERPANLQCDSTPPGSYTEGEALKQKRSDQVKLDRESGTVRDRQERYQRRCNGDGNEVKVETLSNHLHSP